MRGMTGELHEEELEEIKESGSFMPMDFLHRFMAGSPSHKVDGTYAG